MAHCDALEYDLFVPTVEQSGHRYTDSDTESIRAEIIQFFGGLTDTRHRNEGIWKVGGIEVRDEIVIWRVLSTKGADGDRFIEEIQKRLQQQLKQEHILVIRRAVQSLGI